MVSSRTVPTVYWLGPIRYLRWVAAVAVLTVGLYAEFRPQNTVDYPFASEVIHRGDAVVSIDWKRVPAGLLPHPDLDAAVAAVDIGAGEPLLPGLMMVALPVPAGWWSIPVSMPFVAPVGSHLQLVNTESGAVSEGIVVAAPPDDPFAIDPAALVAVPPEHAAAFAVAAAVGRVTALIAAG